MSSSNLERYRTVKIAELKAFYEDDLVSVEQLAEANNCCCMTIRKMLKKAGTKMRAPGRIPKFS